MERPGTSTLQPRDSRARREAADIEVVVTKKNGTPTVLPREVVALDELQPHARNYREHPDDQRAQLVASIRQNGLYRNIVVARDGTILAGHGVVEAAREAGLTEVPVVRLDVDADDPRALRVLAGDNELARLAMIDDRSLAELLRDVRDSGEGLLGTGYDDAMLANLVFITRTEDEIGDRSDADAWVGLPIYEGASAVLRLIVNFDSEEDRESFMQKIGVETIHQRNRTAHSIWWPPREREDVASLRFVSEGRE